jgi:hypothetical protein
MKKRGAADECISALEDLLYERLKIIYGSGAFEAVDTQSIQKLLKSVTKITPQDSDSEILLENIKETEGAVKNYNESIAVYNACISRFPMNIMACLLHLEREIY